MQCLSAKFACIPHVCALLGHTSHHGDVQDQWAVHQLDCSAVTSPAAVLRFLPDPERTSGVFMRASSTPKTLTAPCPVEMQAAQPVCQ